MSETASLDEYAENVFGEGDTTPKKKKPGRPPGSKNKPKAKPETGTELTAWLPPNEEKFAPETVISVPRVGYVPAPAPPVSGDVAERVTKWMEETLAKTDFLAFGTKARHVVVFLQDVSPSERAHEGEWVSGTRSMAAELGKFPAARNQIDVIHATGDESFRVLSAGPGKDFSFPRGLIRYGHGTSAIPWLQGVEAALTAYCAHITKLGVQVREKVVVFCSDFGFSDDFRTALEDFHAWAKKDKYLTVVPAVFGDAMTETAEKFSTRGAPVVSLDKVKLDQFIRVVSQSMVRVSQAVPQEGGLGSEIAKAVGPHR